MLAVVAYLQQRCTLASEKSLQGAAMQQQLAHPPKLRTYITPSSRVVRCVALDVGVPAALCTHTACSICCCVLVAVRWVVVVVVVGGGWGRMDLCCISETVAMRAEVVCKTRCWQ